MLSSNIGAIFFQKNVQKILKDITRYDEKILFARKQVKRLRSPKLMFMTDKQLEDARKAAYDQVAPKIQMPPVMEADERPPKILAKNDEIKGFNKHKIMFVDIGRGYSNRTRLMSVREADGTLRYPTHEERSRMNHVFFPRQHASLDPPKMFDDEPLEDLLRKREYVFILSRACVQFEPDDPRYVRVTQKVYDYIDDCSDFRTLRSTRFFGPMSIYLAYNNRVDNLLIEMIALNFIDDATKLIKLYYICHNISELDDSALPPHKFIMHYIDNHSLKKDHVKLALQSYLAKHPPEPKLEAKPFSSKSKDDNKPSSNQ